ADAKSFSGSRGLSERPSPAERRLAGAIWRAALAGPGQGMAWIVLPLQEEPALRLLVALRSEVWYAFGQGEAESLRVLCGDAVDRDALAELAATRDLPFPVWGVSSDSVPSRTLR